MERKVTLLQRTQDALASLDIESALPEAVLGDDLGIDSQELVCIASDLENLFSIQIRDDDLSRDMSVLQLAMFISRKLAARHRIGQFDYQLYEDVTIAAPLAAVYEALFDVDKWPAKLPHVRGIRKQYDDGCYQEFDMDVQGENGAIMAVHSIRRCQADRIRFFQPMPPKFMRHHCGEWILQPLQENLTHLATRHEWRLATNVDELFPSRDGVPSARGVELWLAGHARAALVQWKTNLEGGAAA